MFLEKVKKQFSKKTYPRDHDRQHGGRARDDRARQNQETMKQARRAFN